jgi:hypothetical protein
MSRTLQFKRYSNTALLGITGAAGELIVDSTNKTVTVHDGSTVGGTRLATENWVKTNEASIAFAQAAYNQANSAANTANSSLVLSNYAFGVDLTQNTNINIIQAGIVAANANIGYLQTTTAAAYNQANSSALIGINALGFAQAAYNQANTAAQVEPQNAQSTSYVIQSSDAGKHIYYTNGSAVNLYVPWTANTTFANGTFIKVISRSTSNVIITPNTGVSLYAAGNSTSGNHNVVTYGVATLQMVAANTWFVYGTGIV